MTILQESLEHTVNLQEDEPRLIAHMLLYIYTDEQQDAKAHSVRQILSTAAHDPSAVDEELIEHDNALVLAAEMYGMGDKYGVSGLKKLCHKRYLDGILTKPMTLEVLIPLIEAVYSLTPENDVQLRKWAVWRCQNHRKTLHDDDEYLELIRRRPDFATDFLTRYAAHNYVWCSNCRHHIDLVCCKCGWSGMCGQPLCKAVF